MLETLARIRAELAAVHPGLPALCLAFIVGAAVWLWRLLHSSSFEKLPKSVQALPALLLSGLGSLALSGGDPLPFLIDAIGSTLLAIGGHHAAVKHVLPQKLPSVPPTLPLLVLCLGLASCSGRQETAESALLAAECSGIRTFYEHMRHELIETGVCDQYDEPEQCPAHGVLEELYVATLLERKCPSEK